LPVIAQEVRQLVGQGEDPLRRVVVAIEEGKARAQVGKQEAAQWSVQRRHPGRHDPPAAQPVEGVRQTQARQLDHGQRHRPGDGFTQATRERFDLPGRSPEVLRQFDDP
jgi:hypothetical protein